MFDQPEGRCEPLIRCAVCVGGRFGLPKRYHLDTHPIPPRSGSGLPGDSLFVGVHGANLAPILWDVVSLASTLAVDIVRVVLREQSG